MKDKNTVGITHTIRLNAMNHVVNMHLAGMQAREIRQELEDAGVRKSIIPVLLSWTHRNYELINDALICCASLPQSDWMPLHWVVLSVNYPFWHSIGTISGRLLRLQKMITGSQVITRSIEKMGEKETVIRGVGHVMRSFIDFGVLTGLKYIGDNQEEFYQCQPQLEITDPMVIMLLLESVLLNNPGRSGAMGDIVNHPALFPFRLPVIYSETIKRHSDRISVHQYSDHTLLTIE